MYYSLVVLNNKEIICTSEVVAEKFKKRHQYVVKKIEQLISNISKFKWEKSLPLKFTLSEKKYRNQSYKIYLMNREAFSLLCMGFSGLKALEWQTKFNHAFYQMEQALLRQSNLEWQREREQGKQIRLNLTDEIKTFIDYAVAHGSKNAQYYYPIITNMQYRALGLIEKNEKVDKKFRNTLDMMDLHNLLSSEQIARKALMDGIDQKLHYKDIYQLAKKRVLQFADIILIKDIIQLT